MHLIYTSESFIKIYKLSHETARGEAYMTAIIVFQPRRTTMSNVIHDATRVVRPMKIVTIIANERGGWYVVSMVPRAPTERSFQ
jgi:hypothetical protein